MISMDNLVIRLIRDKKEFDQVIEIRKQVFVKEQNVPYDLEVDRLDPEAEHFIVFFNEKPIGCARIFTKKGCKLERIAVLKTYRNKGYGKELTKYLIQYCKNKGFKEIYLHSQTYVSDFYKKLGFKERGDTFLEAGIEHVEMYLES